jgi:redox-sensitive bicupin YhaK (pirin superfamily)
MGNRRELKSGEIQLMRAGSGVSHSEFNPSAHEQAHFLQIWIMPSEQGLPPAYTEWTPPGVDSPKTLVISADGRDGSAQIAQDASIYLIRSEEKSVIPHQLSAGRGLWLHVMRGTATFDGVTLNPGDAASLEEPADLNIQTGPEGLDALLFDLK